MLNLFRHSSVGIGVDLGSSSIKVVGLLKTREGIALTTYASALQRNLLMDASVPDGVSTMAAVIREMFRRSRMSRGQFTAALPSLSVFSTVLEFPEMPERELEQAVILAAKQAVPTPLESVVLGWAPIGAPREHPPKPQARVNETLESGRPAEGSLLSQGAARPPEETRRLRTRKAQEVFLTAAPKDLVGRYMELFERLGIELTALEVESFPLSRSLLQGERGPVVLVDFGSRMTNFSIVEDGYFRVNQAVDIGGEAMTRAIAERLALEPVAAERAKRTDGLAGSSDALPKSTGRGGTASPLPLQGVPTLPVPGEAIVSPVATALEPVLAELTGKTQAIRRLYEGQRHRTVAKVLLIGGGAKLPGLAAYWERRTGIPTEVGNPWKSILLPGPLVDHLRALGPTFAVAVGLALRAFEPQR